MPVGTYVAVTGFSRLASHDNSRRFVRAIKLKATPSASQSSTHVRALPEAAPSPHHLELRIRTSHLPALSAPCLSHATAPLSPLPPLPPLPPFPPLPPLPPLERWEAVARWGKLVQSEERRGGWEKAWLGRSMRRSERLSGRPTVDGGDGVRAKARRWVEQHQQHVQCMYSGPSPPTKHLRFHAMGRRSKMAAHMTQPGPLPPVSRGVACRRAAVERVGARPCLQVLTS